MLKIILLVVVAAIAVVLVYAAPRPNTFRIERSTRIQAPPAKVAALIDDFHAWQTWSPWEQRDPALQRTFSGPQRGVGAIYEYQGNKQVGQGRMEIIESSLARILIKLDFLQPFEAHNQAEFTLQPDGDGTRLTWAMSGPQPYLFKLVGVFFNMENTVGKDFDQGLAALKEQAEH
ncbi:potassium-transporting ATPase subunit F [Chitiniphilus shinanonensis]|uniref:Potassium-transporting ATPase subunit F n=1 Tax=Chitiniphilus shinanonensis TaxID=553088 RepID=A0ABQ6C056_9NEIS|nr:SRPBCC family protein [Chitiniphilus shinanonensis]GLS05887.1 potassium-transporting ATPase subunit F [Chitiniphilus shinanonensis]